VPGAPISVRRPRPPLLLAFALALLPLGLAPEPTVACPTTKPVITFPVSSVPSPPYTRVSGPVGVSITLPPLPAGWEWTDFVQLKVTKVPGPTQFILGQLLNQQSAYVLWDAPTFLNGIYSLTVTVGVRFTPTGGECGATSLGVAVELVNPSFTRNGSDEEIACPCRECDEQETRSSTDPRTGLQSFDVPITSWASHGASHGFSLRYSSTGPVDPQAPPAPALNGLGEGTQRWSHPYAHSISLWRGQTGKEYALWQANGRALGFQKSGTTWTAPDSGLSLTAGGGTVTSPSYPCNGGTATLQVPQAWFVVKDDEGTEFEFNKSVPGGQTHLVWQTGNCAAYPTYLLTRIRDRWGRVLNVTWSSGAEPRVTQVRDGDGTGLTLAYSGGLLISVADVQGRTHTLAYTAVPDENGVTRQKLTGITVYGPGAPNRAVYNWAFSYRDDANPSLAYGGTYTGDLVIAKTEPDGRSTSYRFEPVILFGASKLRLRKQDWDGRVTRIAWSDPEATGGERVITRIQESPTQALLTYPGGVAIRYLYTMGRLTGMQEVATGRTWSWSYDSKNNLTSVRTPLEATGSPLVQHDYLFDSANRIDQVTTRVRQADGSLGDPVETQFNDLNLPTQVKAFARAGSGNLDQVTRYEYDGGGALTVGNLTKVIEAWGTPLQQESLLFYDTPDGTWGLPTRSRNTVGAEGSIDYHDTTGLALTATSPQNLAVPVGHVKGGTKMLKRAK
jgi:hypothetical protein